MWYTVTFFCFCKLYSNLLPCLLTPVLSSACNENESHLTLDGVRFHTRHRFFLNIDNSVNNKIKRQLVKNDADDIVYFLESLC